MIRSLSCRPRRARGGKVLLLLVLLLAVGGAVAYGLFGERLGLREPDAPPLRGQRAKRGPLKITVVEGGNLSAANSTDLASEVEGRTTILYLIEEGTEVQAGDLLCELDVTELTDRSVQQDISVQTARAAFVKAEQNYEIQQSTNESEIARAQRELEFAKVDLEKYIEGEWPQEQQAAAESITLAEEELKRAEDDLVWSEKLAEKGFLETTQLERDRLAATAARIRLEQQRRAKDLLVRYEYPRRLKELQANVEEMERELKRAELEARAKLVDFEANLASAQARKKLEEDELVELEQQIGKAKILAPLAGMVVYAVEDGGRWSRDQPMAEGTEVRERQKIITIPSSEGMIAEVSLHESVLEKVAVGMDCVLSVDAVPDRRFAGRVKFKAILPDKNSWWANPDLRVYRTEVQVLDADARLRPGMTCSVEILVATLDDVVHVPIQSIFLDGGSTVCFVADGEGVEKRAVEVGENDGKWVHVVSGVEEGEEVLLSPPEGVTLAPAELGSEPAADAPGGGPSGGPPGGPSGGVRPSNTPQGGGDWSGGASAGGGDARRAPSGGEGGRRPGAGGGERSGRGEGRPGGGGGARPDRPRGGGDSTAARPTPAEGGGGAPTDGGTSGAGSPGGQTPGGASSGGGAAGAGADRR